MIHKVARAVFLACSAASLAIMSAGAAPVVGSQTYRLPLIGWVAVVLFFASTALFPWIAAVLGRDGPLLSGTITGVFISFMTWLFAGYQFALILLAWLIPVGLILDLLVSRDYRRAKAKNSAPAWWAGGRWMDAD